MLIYSNPHATLVMHIRNPEINATHKTLMGNYTLNKILVLFFLACDVHTGEFSLFLSFFINDNLAVTLGSIIYVMTTILTVIS